MAGAPRREAMMGRVFVISAPSGTGKTTIVRRLARRLPSLAVIRSCTTRPPRTGERDGLDYHFISPSRFDVMVDRGAFLEWAEVFGHRYGTPGRAVEEAFPAGRDVILTIVTRGGLLVKKRVPGAMLIGILPPSVTEQEERIRRRKDTDDGEIRRRLDEARRERRVLREHYDVRVVNRDLDRVVERLARLMSRK